ncbi:V-type proton ATPase proteolipid subunit [Spironucleus salmonicida]|uniref:V-type proton ATPase proteolipid subunit n=1 Tax=Spironucleus salmonicida TaxID=348837 RepID=V6LP69_9EUKA|nr:V-type proton ATPase proteolipid subunit [Spironucleus salmonicida]|eukprot:EST45511.1 Vacuolar ATP synthase 16 kDa proteolipid subunit [Spironucleus salmonicida]
MSNLAYDPKRIIEACPYTSSFYSYLGMAIGVSFSGLGSAFGTAKAGKGVVAAGVMKPAQAMKNTLPVIMAGVLGIYGLIIAIVINTSIGKYQNSTQVPLFISFAHLAAGICTGVAALSAGIAIGIAGNAGARASARNSKLFVVMLLILVFGEALALYGLIIGLILSFKDVTCPNRS